MEKINEILFTIGMTIVIICGTVSLAKAKFQETSCCCKCNCTSSK